MITRRSRMSIESTVRAFGRVFWTGRSGPRRKPLAFSSPSPYPLKSDGSIRRNEYYSWIDRDRRAPDGGKPLMRTYLKVVFRDSLALVLGWSTLTFIPPLAESASTADPKPTARPNVLLLPTDDQRADTIHALGNPVIQTPNLDRLAESGFVFRNAYCMGSDQPAVCLPSRTMLLSGRSLFHLHELTVDSPNVPKSMRSAGYLTYHHGKRGNSPHQIHKDFDQSHYLSDDDKERRSGHPGREIADD